MEVYIGRCGRGLSAHGASAAAASGAPCASGGGTGDEDVDMEYGDDNKDDNNYEDDAADGVNDDDDDDEAPGEADASQKMRICAGFTCWLVLYAPTRTTAWARGCPYWTLPPLLQPLSRLWSCRCLLYSPIVGSCALAGSRRKICHSMFAAWART